MHNSSRWFQDGFGQVGLNKYDAKFPNPGGFNHAIYSLIPQVMLRELRLINF